MRNYLLMGSLAVAMLLGWHYRSPLVGLLDGYRQGAKPIVFDNGSVREPDTRGASGNSTDAADVPAGAPRKCVRGQDVTYTNIACPRGFIEKPLAADRVSVVSNSMPGKDGKSGTPQGEHKPALREMLDVNDNGELRQKIIDRAVDNTRK